MYSPKRYEAGFTIVEIIAVLLLLSIIAATVMGRSITTENIDLTSQVDKIRNHYRYAHSMAMKHGDTVWGFKCAADRKSYWIFRLDTPIANPISESDLPANKVMLPGEDNSTVDIDSKGVNMLASTIFFDRFGIPYLYYIEEGNPINIAIPNIQTFSIYTTSASPITRYLKVLPETGVIR